MWSQKHVKPAKFWLNMLNSPVPSQTIHFNRSYNELNCKWANIIYGLSCNSCRLYMSVSYTKGYVAIYQASLWYSLLIFQPTWSFYPLARNKTYHRTNNLHLATPLRRQKEDYWIRKFGTATSYDINHKFDGIGILSSPICISMNRRRYCRCHNPSLIFHDF
jgi:hypothetical protein